MEGPTPVSALIHAATMVTAGVFLLIRFSILFEYSTKILKLVIFLGCLTALVSALIGSFQYDVKKIIAYSTCSQLGYMVVSCGLSNYILGLFHLFNHAFFKALLFLSSGLFIAFVGEQDIRKYNIFFKKTPLLYLFFLIPNLSLCGFPFFSGAFSKELIIQYSKLNFLLEGDFTYNILLFSAGLTTFYSSKLFYHLFIKKPTIKIKNV
jgi:NADH-ubiquinone oxidoreductase chain 5